MLYNYEYLNCTISCCAIFVLQQLGAFTVVIKAASKFLLLLSFKIYIFCMGIRETVKAFDCYISGTQKMWSMTLVHCEWSGLSK